MYYLINENVVNTVTKYIGAVYAKSRNESSPNFDVSKALWEGNTMAALRTRLCSVVRTTNALFSRGILQKTTIPAITRLNHITEGQNGRQFSSLTQRITVNSIMSANLF